MNNDKPKPTNDKLRMYSDGKLAELRQRVLEMKQAPKKWRDRRLAELDAEIERRGDLYLP